MSTKKASGGDGDSRDQVCRGFLRNECRRGKGCKYLHPNEGDGSGSAPDGTVRKTYIFCRDFQNSQCTRRKCRFIHCTRKVEQYFKMTGEWPEHSLPDSIRKGTAIDPSNPGDEPVCKDYLKGFCRRAGGCKFRHLSLREYELEFEFRIKSFPSWTGLDSTTAAVAVSSRPRDSEDGDHDCYGNSGSISGSGYDGDLVRPEVKRRVLDSHISTSYFREESRIPNEQLYPAQTFTTDMAPYYTAVPARLNENGTATEEPQVETEEQTLQGATSESENYRNQNVSHDYEPYGLNYPNCCYNPSCYNTQHWDSQHDMRSYYSPNSAISNSHSSDNEQYWQGSQHTNSHRQF